MERRQYLVWHNWGFDPFTNRIMHILNVEFVSLFSGDIYFYEYQKLLRYGTQCSIMSMSIIAQKRIWRGLRCGSCCVCNNNLEGHNWCHNVKVSAPSGNRTQGNCLEGNYVTTTPMVLFLKLQVSSIITIPPNWEQIKDLTLFSWTQYLHSL